MIYNHSNKRLVLKQMRHSRKAQPTVKPSVLMNKRSKNVRSRRARYTDMNKSKQFDSQAFYDLTKFRLSQYNTLASYSMYLYY